MRFAAIVPTFATSLTALLLYRQLRQFAWARRSHDTDSRNILIVGGGAVARSIARTLCNDPLHRALVRGCLDDYLPLSTNVLGRIADLDWLARAEFIDEVIIALHRGNKSRRGRPLKLRSVMISTFAPFPIYPLDPGPMPGSITSERCR